MNPTKDTPGGSFTRQTGAASVGGLIAWGLSAIAANNGIPIPQEILIGLGATIAGGLGALWRRFVLQEPA